MARTTTAALLTAPGRIEVVERALPAPGHGQIALRVVQCGVCGSDVDRWTGRADGDLPAVLGHEVSGMVEDAGPGVEGLRPGDRVAAWLGGGGFAGHAVADERACVPVPATLAYPAVAEPLACVVNAVELAAPALGDDVLVVGAGYMGNLVQLVTALKGPRSITVADVRQEALARAAALGATRVVDLRAEPPDGIDADVTYEVTGVQDGLTTAGEATRLGGKLVIVGYHQGDDRRVPLGSWNWNALQLVNAHFRAPATILAGMRTAIRLAAAGLVDAAPLVTHRFPLDAVGAAFETAAARPDGFVKAVVEPLPAD